MSGKHPKAKATMSPFHRLLKMIEPLIMGYPSRSGEQTKVRKKTTDQAWWECPAFYACSGFILSRTGNRNPDKT
jgi:hypothetical protein